MCQDVVCKPPENVKKKKQNQKKQKKKKKNATPCELPLKRKEEEYEECFAEVYENRSHMTR